MIKTDNIDELGIIFLNTRSFHILNKTRDSDVWNSENLHGKRRFGGFTIIKNIRSWELDFIIYFLSHYSSAI